MTPSLHWLEADLTYAGGGFVSGISVGIDARSGRIAALDQAQRGAQRLAGRALLPGFINVHSHAFQRGLRGLAEKYGGAAGNFWSWREHMYDLVERLDPASFEAICTRVYRDMLAAGVTSVGEFHYLHHRDPQRCDFELDDALLRAASAAGIRLVLLQSYYRTGSIGTPLQGGQRRFSTPSVDGFLEQLDRLAGRLDPRTQTLAIAPHSVRAVPTEDLIALSHEAARRSWPMHMHVEEQIREMGECQAAYGVPPMRWLLDNVAVDDRFTAIHATHTHGALMDEYLSRGARVCVCPGTEGNLGDGIADLARVLCRPDALCIGSDCNLRLDFCEELRWMEFVQRLRHQRRGVLAGAEGDLAAVLWNCGTRNGAAALRLSAGEIAAGLAADFFAIDLNHAAFERATPETLLTQFLMCSGPAAIRETWVAGRQVHSAAT